jgi:restriction system protein
VIATKAFDVEAPTQSCCRSTTHGAPLPSTARCPAIKEFLGALQDVEAAKGIFITTSSFSPDARELARRRRIGLMDGLELATHMVDAGVGVTTLETYALKRIDEDYFAEVE